MPEAYNTRTWNWVKTICVKINTLPTWNTSKIGEDDEPLANKTLISTTLYRVNASSTKNQELLFSPRSGNIQLEDGSMESC